MNDEGTVYCIRVQGHLGPEWSSWFDNLTITCEADGTTRLYGPVADQAALHGLLIRVRDLGLALIAVNQVEKMEDGKMEE